MSNISFDAELSNEDETFKVEVLATVEKCGSNNYDVSIDRVDPAIFLSEEQLDFLEEKAIDCYLDDEE